MEKLDDAGLVERHEHEINEVNDLGYSEDSTVRSFLS
jgi:hypothetical protein